LTSQVHGTWQGARPQKTPNTEIAGCCVGKENAGQRAIISSRAASTSGNNAKQSRSACHIARQETSKQCFLSVLGMLELNGAGAHRVSVYQVICSQLHSGVSRFACCRRCHLGHALHISFSDRSTATVGGREESNWMRINGLLLPLFNNLRIKIWMRVDNYKQLEAEIDA
jgi:hypothetical protein